jgi:hypothetical protein
VDHLADLGQGGALLEVAVGAAIEHRALHARRREPGEHHDLGVGRALAQRLDHLQAVAVGHGQVEQDHIGLLSLHGLDALGAVRRLADHLDARVALEAEAHEVAKLAHVVAQADPDHGSGKIDHRTRIRDRASVGQGVEPHPPDAGHQISEA